MKQYWFGWSIILLLVVLTHLRNETWKSQEAVWRDVVSKSPEKPRGYIQLGDRLYDQLETKAKTYYAQPHEIFDTAGNHRPINYYEALHVTIKTKDGGQLYNEALENFQKVRDLASTQPDPLGLKSGAAANMAMLYLMDYRVDDARRLLRQVIKDQPKLKIGYIDLAFIETNVGNPAEALTILNSPNFDPDDKMIQFNKAEIYNQLGDCPTARALYGKALDHSLDFPAGTPIPPCPKFKQPTERLK